MMAVRDQRASFKTRYCEKSDVPAQQLEAVRAGNTS
jgi:hypothetical protein